MSRSRDVIIAPSLLSSDFERIGAHLGEIEAAGADWHHVDVMDGHFVPNLTIGPPVVKAIRRATTLPLDCHLMITHPLQYVDAFADAGATGITFHLEAADDPASVIDAVRARKIRVGMALNPDTPLDGLLPHLDRLDMVLVMSVFPGFGGQSFMPEVLEKTRALRHEHEWNGDIEMDGGINAETVVDCAAAGANVIVAGTAVFGADDPAAAIAALRERAVEAGGGA